LSRPPVDSQPVMVKIDPTSQTYKAFIAEQEAAQGQLTLPLQNELNHAPQQTEQLGLFENDGNQPNVPGVAQYGLSQDTQRNPAPLNRGLFDGPMQVGLNDGTPNNPAGSGPLPSNSPNVNLEFQSGQTGIVGPVNQQSANEVNPSLRSDPTGTADLDAAGLNLPAANDERPLQDVLPGMPLPEAV